MSSPGSLGGSNLVPVFKSTMAASVSGNGSPMDPIFFLPLSGFKWVTGDASVRPKPSIISAPVSSLNFFDNSLGIGADPVIQ